jgi:hypothetical protein
MWTFELMWDRLVYFAFEIKVTRGVLLWNIYFSFISSHFPTIAADRQKYSTCGIEATWRPSQPLGPVWINTLLHPQCSKL